jgi:hypothetical protein
MLPVSAAHDSISFVFLPSISAEAEVRRSMARLRALGWHARLHVYGNDLVDNSDLLRYQGRADGHRTLRPRSRVAWTSQ